MSEPKKLRLRALVDEIVTKEGIMPILEAITEVDDDEKSEYKIRKGNYKQRLSALYEEVNRRQKLYNY